MNNLMKILLLVQFFFISTLAFADVETVFRSDLHFIKENSIIPDQVETYKLEENLDVVLLTGVFENDKIFAEVSNQKDRLLRDRLLKEASSVDPLNQQHNRTSIEFQKQKEGEEYRIYSKYSYQKNNITWGEENLYIVTNGHMAYASVSYPLNIKQNLLSEISKGIKDFRLVSSQNKKTAIFESERPKQNYSFGVKRYSSARLSILENILFPGSFANQSSAYEVCGGQKYIIRGEWTYKPGSALFDFEKMVQDLKKEAAQANPDNDQLSCLANLIKEARDNSSTYWAERAARESCTAEEGGTRVIAKTENCSEANFKNIEKSINYLGGVDKDLNKFLNGEGNAEVDENGKIICTVGKDPNSNAKELKKLGASAQEGLCCEANEDSKGPLFQLVEDDLKETGKGDLSLSAKTELCLNKSTKNKSNGDFLSVNGIGDCAKNAADGLISAVKNLIKMAVSLVDGELIKALHKFISNLPDSINDLFKNMGESLATQLYSVNNYMNPYEAKQYFCKAVPELLTYLTGPGMIKKFIKSATDKALKTEFGKMVGEAAKNSKKLQKLKEISANAKAKVKKASEPVLNHKLVKPSVATLKKIKNVLGKDVSTPFKNLVKDKLGQVKAATVGSAQKLGQKVLRSRSKGGEGKQIASSAEPKNIPEKVTGADDVGKINPKAERDYQINPDDLPSMKAEARTSGGSKRYDDQVGPEETTTAKTSKETAPSEKTVPDSGPSKYQRYKDLAKSGASKSVEGMKSLAKNVSDRFSKVKMPKFKKGEKVIVPSEGRFVDAKVVETKPDGVIKVSWNEGKKSRYADLKPGELKNASDEFLADIGETGKVSPGLEKSRPLDVDDLPAMKAEPRSSGGNNRYSEAENKPSFASKVKESAKAGYDKAKTATKDFSKSVREKFKKSETSDEPKSNLTSEHNLVRPAEGNPVIPDDVGGINPGLERSRPLDDAPVRSRIDETKAGPQEAKVTPSQNPGKVSYPKLEVEKMPESLKSSGSNVRDFIDKISKTDVENKMRHTEYGKVFGAKNSRVIKQKADKLHQDIESLSNNKLISNAEAKSLHESVSITESYARGSKKVREYKGDKNIENKGTDVETSPKVEGSFGDQGNVSPGLERSREVDVENLPSLQAEPRSSSGSPRYAQVESKPGLASKMKDTVKNGFGKAKTAVADMSKKVAEKMKRPKNTEGSETKAKSTVENSNVKPAEGNPEIPDDVGRINPGLEESGPVGDLPSLRAEQKTTGGSKRYAEPQKSLPAKLKENAGKAFKGVTAAMKNTAKRVAEKFKRGNSKLKSGEDVVIEKEGNFANAQVLAWEGENVRVLTAEPNGYTVYKVSKRQIKEASERVVNNEPPATKTVEVKLSEMPPTPGHVSYPKVKVENLPENLKASGSNVKDFVEKISKTDAENKLRHTDYENIFGTKHSRVIKQRADKLHQDIEVLFKQNVISEAEANSMHESVALTEASARRHKNIRDIKVNRELKSGPNESAAEQ